MQYLDIGDHIDVSSLVLLKQNPRRQQSEVLSGLKKISKQLKKAHLNIIGLHATHFCNGIPIFPCSAEALSLVSPDMSITLLDDVYACRIRLEKAGYPFNYSQLLLWRQIELGIADSLAAACKCENVFFAGKHPRIAMYRLVFEPRCPRIYSASQITNVRNSPELAKEIDKHRERIHKQFVVFDPLTIDDRILINTIPPTTFTETTHGIQMGLRWPCGLSHLGEDYKPLIEDGTDFFPLTVDVSETRDLAKPVERISIRNVIDAQITNRDFRYIDQSDVVSAYRPRLNGKESGGVAAEKTYASGVAEKPVVEYSTKTDLVGFGSRPFSTDLSGPVISELDAFYAALVKTAKSEATRRCARSREICARFEAFRDIHS